MAELARFYGIVIAMFYRDHGRAHIHAYYAGKVAVISVDDGKVIVGQIPRASLRLLRTAWAKAKKGENVGRIRPLR